MAALAVTAVDPASADVPVALVGALLATVVADTVSAELGVAALAVLVTLTPIVLLVGLVATGALADATVTLDELTLVVVLAATGWLNRLLPKLALPASKIRAKRHEYFCGRH